MPSISFIRRQFIRSAGGGTFFALLAACLLPFAASAAPDVETIVCLRHGEKTAIELGQLNIRGLNRSLALPEMLISRYGPPRFIFAPDPARQLVGKNDKYYDYVRPLATIEPTAIRCGLPVNTSFGYKEIDGLEGELLKPDYRNALVFVAWEHLWEAKFVRQLVAHLGGKPAEVPDWPGPDFDSLYVIRITREDGRTTVSFTHDHENLNGASTQFPSPPPNGV